MENTLTCNFTNILYNNDNMYNIKHINVEKLKKEQIHKHA